MTNNKIAANPQGTRISRLLYLTGFSTLFLIGALSLVLRSGGWFITALEVVCALSFGLGFCIRARPALMYVGSKTYGKGLLALYHAVVLALSSIPAKFILSNSLHLPPGDYPITLAMWSLLCYPGVWLAGTAFLALVVYTLMLLAASATLISTQPLLNAPLLFIARLLPDDSTLRNAISNGRQKLIWRSFGHAAGAAVMAVSIGAAAGWWLQGMNQPRMVKLFAYAADYDLATAYPGVDASVPFRLHDNGVVSYATFSRWDVTIRVARIQESK
ncbi:hypothetical protein [Paraburkholderia sp. JHI869]|uniref:hypothetical protein n=1 Tax=Paraburkholderia sp. JHI869 TaxID=3112959 RepID=UPI00317FC7AA